MYKKVKSEPESFSARIGRKRKHKKGTEGDGRTGRIIRQRLDKPSQNNVPYRIYQSLLEFNESNSHYSDVESNCDDEEGSQFVVDIPQRMPAPELEVSNQIGGY